MAQGRRRERKKCKSVQLCNVYSFPVLFKIISPEPETLLKRTSFKHFFSSSISSFLALLSLSSSFFSFPSFYYPSFFSSFNYPSILPILLLSPTFFNLLLHFSLFLLNLLLSFPLSPPPFTLLLLLPFRVNFTSTSPLRRFSFKLFQVSWAGNMRGWQLSEEGRDVTTLWRGWVGEWGASSEEEKGGGILRERWGTFSEEGIGGIFRGRDERWHLGRGRGLL